MKWLAVGLLLLVGCASSIYLGVESENNANFGAPVQVDFVFVRDADLERQLITLSAQEWFAKRTQVERDYPDKGVLDVVSFEFIPGQKIHQMKVKGNGADHAIVFVNFGRSTGTGRARVPVGSTVSLRLGETAYHLDVQD
jgi:hypothetical protein